MRILIIGSGGQLGQAFMESETEYELAPVTSAELDITRLDEVRRVVGTIRPTVIIVKAAKPNVALSFATASAACFARASAWGVRTGTRHEQGDSAGGWPPCA